MGLEDVSKYPDLVMELLRRGYTDDDVRKVVGKNLLRAMKTMEQVGFQLGPVALVPLVGLQISCPEFARFIFSQYYKLSPNSLRSLSKTRKSPSIFNTVFIGNSQNQNSLASRFKPYFDFPIN